MDNEFRPFQNPPTATSGVVDNRTTFRLLLAPLVIETIEVTEKQFTFRGVPNVSRMPLLYAGLDIATTERRSPHVEAGGRI